ncbi:hypothetical protein V493_03690 [Pseudogymnoascus sp. VKM F-4281 (FW-2241)]|nr:hypothetical protein V493_03690 [Pseudogymnoascus sp. VKM F-4281 (FW-2241)]
MAGHPSMDQYVWLIAIISIAFCASSFGNGANDVANAYATSVAARTLEMWQVGILAMCTEFIGAVALGSGVTSTIKNGIMDIKRFEDAPATLILAMTCAEIGSATWLLTATRFGFPVSTTQTIVGAMIGAGLAAEATISWGWKKGSVSQIAASWLIAPLLSCCFSAILFLTLKFAVLERRDPFKWAMRLIPFYLAFTGGVLALFIVIEMPDAEDLEDYGTGKIVGIILGVFFGVLAISYIFFVPYFHRRLVMGDARVKAWHIPMGPLLLKENIPLYLPGNKGVREGEVVTDHYASQHVDVIKDDSEADQSSIAREKALNQEKVNNDANNENDIPIVPVVPSTKEADSSALEAGPTAVRRLRVIEPEERFLAPTAHLPMYNPSRIWGMTKYFLLQGVTRDCVTHSSSELAKTHALAKQYDNRVEHLWTYAQVASAMMMSIAHGSNDVANAVGPWVGAYTTFQDGFVSSKANTPIWLLVIAGFLLGAGFWFMGWKIVQALGNKITQMSPTRGFSVELGAAITVLLASRLALPVSTTQCLTGAVMGVALCNFNLGATNWRQLGYIFTGWVMTLPAAGLISGLLMLVALNTPSF